MSYSIHKFNLDTLINIKDYDSVMLIENALQIDSRYLKNWRYPERIDRVSTAIKISFYHYFNLLRLPNIKFSESSSSLNLLSYDEYRTNTVNYLEQALEGLLRLITYYKHYHIKEYNKFEELYNNLSNQIKRSKIEFGIRSLDNSGTGSEISEESKSDTTVTDIIIEKQADHISITSSINETSENDETGGNNESNEVKKTIGILKPSTPI